MKDYLKRYICQNSQILSTISSLSLQNVEYLQKRLAFGFSAIITNLLILILYCHSSSDLIAHYHMYCVRRNFSISMAMHNLNKVEWFTFLQKWTVDSSRQSGLHCKARRKMNFQLIFFFSLVVQVYFIAMSLQAVNNHSSPQLFLEKY